MLARIFHKTVWRDRETGNPLVADAACGAGLSGAQRTRYFGPNNSNTSGSLCGGLVAEGSDRFCEVFVVFTSNGIGEEDLCFFIFANPTTKLRGMGF